MGGAPQTPHQNDRSLSNLACSLPHPPHRTPGTARANNPRAREMLTDMHNNLLHAQQELEVRDSPEGEVPVELAGAGFDIAGYSVVDLCVASCLSDQFYEDWVGAGGVEFWVDWG